MIDFVMKAPGRAFVLLSKVRRRLKMLMLRPLFRRHGRNFIFDPDAHYSFGTIEVGDDVFIAHGASLGAAISTIRIGSKVMLGPGVMIRGGNHNTSVVGVRMADVRQKLPGDDEDVHIEDDVWIGAGAIILKGVRIARGSIVAAGAVVTKSFPPYSIIGGVPARLIRPRWDEATICRHEELLARGDRPPAP